MTGQTTDSATADSATADGATTDSTADGGASSARNARRKNRTRSALIAAAQQILAGGDGVDVSIQAITDLADVGLGSFYNHFESKAELFSAASAIAFGQYREWIAEQIGDERDPVRVLTMSIRLTGRLSGSQPELARILSHHVTEISTGAERLAPGVVDDLVAALGVSPFSADDPDVTVVSAAGAIAAVLRVAVGHDQGEQERMTDAVARNVLRMFGTGEELIAELLAVPVPVPALRPAGSTAR